eukprot:COSAG02_NODE_1610_length_11681_cov_11.455103_13_plen_217_part_01
MHVRVRRQNQIVTCDADENCDEDPLVAQLSPSCLACLVAQDGQQTSGPPPIGACLSGGGAPSSGGDGDGPPACILDQIAPFMEAEDETGMVQYICSDQFDTSTCDDVEMALIDSETSGMCGDGDDVPACVLDQLAPFMEAEDETGMAQYICSDQFDTSTCDDVEMALIDSETSGMCGDGDGPPGCAGVDPVCAESDMGITQGLQFEDMTQGCQCCFM